jgi:hypothetical protein
VTTFPVRAARATAWRRPSSTASPQERRKSDVSDLRGNAGAFRLEKLDCALLDPGHAGLAVLYLTLPTSGREPQIIRLSGNVNAIHSLPYFPSPPRTPRDL